MLQSSSRLSVRSLSEDGRGGSGSGGRGGGGLEEMDAGRWCGKRKEGAELPASREQGPADAHRAGTSADLPEASAEEHLCSDSDCHCIALPGSWHEEHDKDLPRGFRTHIAYEMRSGLELLWKFPKKEAGETGDREPVPDAELEIELEHHHKGEVQSATFSEEVVAVFERVRGRFRSVRAGYMQRLQAGTPKPGEAHTGLSTVRYVCGGVEKEDEQEKEG
eukprot:180578-Rhodomonas_salina.1